MKDKYGYGLSRLCQLLGITRQAYYQHAWLKQEKLMEQSLLLDQIKTIRLNHPRMGTRKLYKKLQPFLIAHHIKVGRDALFGLLSDHQLLVRKHKRRIQTTNSFHWLRKHPNLIRGFVPTAPNQLWVSDITYWKINTGEHLYISFITDAYSHKIVGYQVAQTMETIESIQALQRALSALGAECPLDLIHHSDRGVQYCSQSYVKLLQDYGIKISMTEKGDPLENAIAERVNGVMKDEYLEAYPVENIQQATELLQKAVCLYNNERPHMSIGNNTPNTIHQSNLIMKPKKLWKNYYQKPTFANQ